LPIVGVFNTLTTGLVVKPNYKWENYTSPRFLVSADLRNCISMQPRYYSENLKTAAVLRKYNIFVLKMRMISWREEKTVLAWIIFSKI
jgi:hypothetical protein